MKLVVLFTVVLLTTFSFSQTERVYTKIENAPVITVQNASTYTSYENTLESIVNYFYASRIRKDKEWEKVVQAPEERSERMQYKLKKYDTWTITNFHLVSKAEFEPGKFWVKVYFKIEMDGRSEDGIDTAEVHLINGKWVLVTVPT